MLEASLREKLLLLGKILYYRKAFILRIQERSRQGDIYLADFLRIQRLLPKETYSVIIFLTAGCLHMAGYLLRDP